MAKTSASSHTLIDHEEIRSWAEERGAKPAAVRGTGNDDDDVGMIRLDFPGYKGEGSLEEISWDDWFEKFEESNLALLVQDETADDEESNFNKLISRDRMKPNSGSHASASASTGRSTGEETSQRTGSHTMHRGPAKETADSNGKTTSNKKAGADGSQSRGRKSSHTGTHSRKKIA